MSRDELLINILRTVSVALCQHLGLEQPDDDSLLKFLKESKPEEEKPFESSLS